jgi:DNA-binding transcriptional MerR regulator
MKISEIAHICRISPRMLRHYDSIGLLKPSKVDSQTAYREYSVKQISVLQRILVFKDLGFSLEEIKSLIEAPNLEPVLQQQKIVLEQRILAEQARLARLEAYLHHSKEKIIFQVEVKSLPSQLVAAFQDASLVQQFPEGGQDISKLIEVFVQDLKPFLESDQAVPHSIFWYGTNEYPIPELIQPMMQAQDFKVAAVKTLESEPQAACLEFVGNYADDEMTQAFTFLFSWLEEQGFSSKGVIRQVYQVVSDNVFRIELQIPFSRA